MPIKPMTGCWSIGSVGMAFGLMVVMEGREEGSDSGFGGLLSISMSDSDAIIDDGPLSALSLDLFTHLQDHSTSEGLQGSVFFYEES